MQHHGILSYLATVLQIRHKEVSLVNGKKETTIMPKRFPEIYKQCRCPFCKLFKKGCSGGKKHICENTDCPGIKFHADKVLKWAYKCPHDMCCLKFVVNIVKFSLQNIKKVSSAKSILHPFKNLVGWEKLSPQEQELLQNKLFIESFLMLEKLQKGCFEFKGSYGLRRSQREWPVMDKELTREEKQLAAQVQLAINPVAPVPSTSVQDPPGFADLLERASSPGPSMTDGQGTKRKRQVKLSMSIYACFLNVYNVVIQGSTGRQAKAPRPEVDARQPDARQPDARQPDVQVVHQEGPQVKTWTTIPVEELTSKQLWDYGLVLHRLDNFPAKVEAAANKLHGTVISFYCRYIFHLINANFCDCRSRLWTCLRSGLKGWTLEAFSTIC